MPDNTKSAADAIAAKAETPTLAPATPAETTSAEALEPTVDSSWQVEEWRGRYLVVRHVPVKGSPMVRREVFGNSKFGASATIFESEELAAKTATKLNKEEKEDE